MATTDPAPEWEWYSQRDLYVGHTQVHDGPFEEDVEAWKQEIRERDAKRIPLGFQVPEAAHDATKPKDDVADSG